MANVQVIQYWARPQTLKGVRSFLGLAKYFRRFVQGYSSLVAPMIQLTRLTSCSLSDWTEQCEEGQIQASRCC
jgi:hypothetical protein